MVKLGAGWLVGDIVNDVDPGGDVELAKFNTLFGDLVGVIGDLMPLLPPQPPLASPKKLHSSISHVLQSRPLTVGCSGQPNGCCNRSCCCCCNVANSDGVLRSPRCKFNVCCCCCNIKSFNNLLLLLDNGLLQFSGVGVFADLLLFDIVLDGCGDSVVCVFIKPSVL